MTTMQKAVRTASLSQAPCELRMAIRDHLKGHSYHLSVHKGCEITGPRPYYRDEVWSVVIYSTREWFVRISVTYPYGRGYPDDSPEWLAWWYSLPYEVEAVRDDDLEMPLGRFRSADLAMASARQAADNPCWWE